jgi:hypothetical protein
MSIDEDILEELQELNSKIYHYENPFAAWFGLIWLLIFVPIMFVLGLLIVLFCPLILICYQLQRIFIPTQLAASFFSYATVGQGFNILVGIVLFLCKAVSWHDIFQIFRPDFILWFGFQPYSFFTGLFLLSLHLWSIVMILSVFHMAISKLYFNPHNILGYGFLNLVQIGLGFRPSYVLTIIQDAAIIAVSINTYMHFKIHTPFSLDDLYQVGIIAFGASLIPFCLLSIFLYFKK